MVATLVDGRNKVHRLAVGGDLSTVLGRDLQLNLRTQYRFTNRPSVLNGDEVNIQNHFLTLSSKLYYTLRQSVVSIKPGFQFFSNRFANRPTYLLNAEMVYFLTLPSVGNFRMSYTPYLTAQGQQRIWNSLVHFEYKYQFDRLQADVKLQLNNLTNNIYFLDFSQQNFSTVFRYFQLRPRQVVFSFVKRF